MAYTPTVWETGDVITAEKLNKAEEGIAAASVPELPSVEAADQGKVLTVDSSGEWDAADIKDVLILTGSCSVDLVAFTVSNLSVIGDPTKIPEYKTVMLKLTVNLAEADIALMDVIIPYTEHIKFDTRTLTPVNFYAFDVDVVMSATQTTVSMAHLFVEYDIAGESWSGSIYTWQISRS